MHIQYPFEAWPDELRRLPEIYHPDGRRLIHNTQLSPLFKITESAVRERRRQGQLPPSIWKISNRHFSDLHVIADIYLNEFPGRVVEPAPASPTDILLTVRPAAAGVPEPDGYPPNGVLHTVYDDAGKGVSEVSAERQGRRQTDGEDPKNALVPMPDMTDLVLSQSKTLSETTDAIRQLLEQIRSQSSSADGPLTALTDTVAAQSRVIEAQQKEIQRLQEASEKASERRQGFWARLFTKPK